ncbi:enterobactin synthase subunit EntD [Cronobacter turicensis]|uniref:Enterobactin synthase component D n=2 Tax=Cronobacter turicensis TaxID=413502 RepID=A0A2T7B675_9ENTR|nr:enterobactin synthase subunit EntD [Cronobacter turicensis]PUX28759.1 enterobactin synthase subunit EntD [Cronobacter turicensis]
MTTAGRNARPFPMQTTLTPLTFAGQSLWRVDFSPDTFTSDDLLWLPHHAMLANAVVRRQAEHLAGRTAAVAALRAAGAPALPPGIGAHREPRWPAGFTGSITHTGHRAWATVIAAPGCVGIDVENLMDAQTASELAPGIIDVHERAVLARAPLPFASALTLAFSAKESLFKALFPQVGDWFGFECANVVALDAHQLTLRLACPLGPFTQAQCFTLYWRQEAQQILTLVNWPGSD